MIVIIYQNKNEIKVLSKLQFNNIYKIFNVNYKNFNIEEEESISKLIFDLKSKYEDNWKKLNLINTSIRLPLSITLLSKDYKKVQLFEKTLEKLDFVSTYQITSFDSVNTLYKVIYNGSPDKFINHGTQAELYNECFYDSSAIIKSVHSILEKSNVHHGKLFLLQLILFILILLLLILFIFILFI